MRPLTKRCADGTACQLGGESRALIPDDVEICDRCLLARYGLFGHGRYDSDDHYSLGPEVFAAEDVVAALRRAEVFRDPALKAAERVAVAEGGREALLGYMEAQSELRWSACWLTRLETALLGDPAYEWLVEQVGGWWEFDVDGYPRCSLSTKRPVEPFRRFVAGSLRELRAKEV